MGAFVIRRLIMLIPLMFLLSVVSFVIIELPPGDWVTTYVNNLRTSGIGVDESEIARLTQTYGFDKPMYQRYLKWIGNLLLHGDFGWSFQWNKPVREILIERVPFTVLISVLTIGFIWAVGIPIGIYSAAHQYSPTDYLFTFLGFIGLAMPSFLLALVVAWLFFAYFGLSVTGLFSAEFINAPWSWAKVIDMLQHVWPALIIIGMSGTGGLIRVMRGNLLDELRKQYVITARAKGVPRRRLLFKYPVRVAINPLVSTIGWILPTVVSGEALVSIVLNLQTTGPVLLRAVLAQDMYLAGSLIMILSALTVIGTLVSDILLAWLDPRIRFEAVEK